MEEKEKDSTIITVDNKNGKGNPNHKPAGSPDGGQFTSKKETPGPTTGSEPDGEEDFDFEDWDDKDESFDFDMELDDFSDDDFGFLNDGSELKPEPLGIFVNDEIQTSIDASWNLMDDGHKAELQAILDEFQPEDFKKVLANAGLIDETQEYSDNDLIQMARVQLMLNMKDTLKARYENAFDKYGTKLKEIDSQFSLDGVWKYKTVHPSDYPALKEAGSIEAKRDWYLNYESDKEKAALMLQKLDEFEKFGEEYLTEKAIVDARADVLKQEWENWISDAYDSLKKIAGEFSNFGNNPYSKKRKDAAHWLKGMDNSKMIDLSVKTFGPLWEEKWKQLEPYERNQIVDYTGGGYSKYNKPLRKIYHSGWSGFNFKEAVDNITSAIDKCTWDMDMWVQRGVSIDSKFLQVNGVSMNIMAYAKNNENLDKLVGTSFKDEAFVSTSVHKGGGFGGGVIFNFYCPKGTKMAYMNTKGHYAGTNEDEMILQRGYSYRITKVTKISDHQYYIDCDVILGSDKDRIEGQELAERAKYLHQ